VLYSRQEKVIGREGAFASMEKTMKFTYWKDGEFFLGYLNDYPDYETQGMTKEELIENLRALLEDVESGEIPYLRKVEEMVVAA
jgi:predicted RNase H-like HicB family nuclease